MTKTKEFLHLALLSLCSMLQHADSIYGQVKDYCQTEMFAASCAADEVVVMTTAEYGRMRPGRCVKKDYGYIGCTADVLRLSDMKCSGRQTCSIRIPDENFEITNRCPDDLKTYFEGAYMCEKVAVASQELCKTSGYVRLSAQRGHLSSWVAKNTGCGSPTTPWILESSPGQRINFTLIDFTSAAVGGAMSVEYGVDLHSERWSTCRDLVIIREDKREKKINNCLVRGRESLIYASTTNSVEIQLINIPADDSHFLVKYEAAGCVDPKTPTFGWMKREGEMAVLGCHAKPDQQWRLVCRDDIWLGPRINCTSPTGASSGRSGWNALNIPDELSIVLVIVIALFIGVVILGLGLIYLRRRAALMQQQAPPSNNDLMYATGREAGMKGGLPPVPHDPRRVKYDENEYALIWEVQNPGVEPAKNLSYTYSRQSSMGPLPPQPRCLEEPGSSHHCTPMDALSDSCIEAPKYFELEAAQSRGLVEK